MATKKSLTKFVLGIFFVFFLFGFVVAVQDYSGLKINEFSSDTSGTDDWVEIYNSGNMEVNLSDCKFVDDSDNELLLSGTINSQGFLAFDWSNRLNNGGDTIELICNGQTIDNVDYGSAGDAPKPEDSESSGRCANGEDTDNDGQDFEIFTNPTKGETNDCEQPQEFVCEDLPNYVTDTADRIIDLQHTDGSWDWKVTNANSPTGTTYRNIAGVTGEILLDTYDLTGDSTYLDAAKDTGDYILGFSISKTNRYNAFNINFLYHLYDVTGNNSYKNHADSLVNHILNEENYWTNNNGNNCGVDGCEASELLDALKSYRSATTNIKGIVVWDLYHFVGAAQTYGDNSFANDMANVLDNYISSSNFNNTIEYYVLGLSGGIIALDNAGVDYSDHLSDLLSSQNPDGSFSSSSIQDASYALMALKVAGEDEAVEDASEFLINEFGYSGINGWKESDGKEYSEVTSEAGQALYESYGLCFTPVPVCGNGIVEQGEECDGGNSCSSSCEIIESGSSNGVGSGVGVNIGTEDFEPKVWMCDDRVVYDDGTEPGRITQDGDDLIERMNNYAFEGEQIKWDVIVWDKNGIEKIEDVYGSLDGQREVNCEFVEEVETADESCNARILEEEVGTQSNPFSDNTAAKYTCTLTVETPESMYGEYDVNVEAIDLDGLVGQADENEFWFLNPEIRLMIDGQISFENVRPGTSSYSDTVLVGNDADQSSGVRLDMFISGTDFYDSNPSGAKCPTSNTLELENFRYYATNGAYSTQDDGRSDSEGYNPIEYGVGFNDPSPFYDRNEIIQAQKLGSYYTTNTLAPGSEMSLTFRLDLPEPCNGDFDTGSIYFWGEAV